jgi:hypothetical protein
MCYLCGAHEHREEILANLGAILAPYARPAGRVMPRKKIQRAMEDAAKKAGITWKQNVLRHSFCSYGVALRGLEWTADQADHDIRILRRNYRENVSREEAEGLFQNQFNSDPGNSFLSRAILSRAAAERISVVT